jgi:hypothetical protein
MIDELILVIEPSGHLPIAEIELPLSAAVKALSVGAALMGERAT